MKRVLRFDRRPRARAGRPLPAYAQDVKPEIAEVQTEKKDMARKEDDGRSAAKQSWAPILSQIDQDAEKKLVALAEATPAEKFAWRPAEGVRSVGEVYAHVSGGNYFLPTFWGCKIPDGIDPRSFEKQGGDKAKTIDTLKKSFDHLKQADPGRAPADLDRTIKMFGQDATVRDSDAGRSPPTATSTSARPSPTPA